MEKNVKRISKSVEYIEYYDTVDVILRTCGLQLPDTKINGPYEPEFNILQYVTKGKGYLELDGKTYDLGAGDIFFLPEGQTCTYYSDVKDPYTYYWISFQGKYAEHILKQCGITKENPVVHVDNHRVEKHFELMYKNMSQHKLPEILMVLSHLYSLFSILTRTTSAGRSFAGHYLIEEAMLYMDHHYCESVTINDICNNLGCDVSHFIKIFKKYQGISPKKYLDSLRLTRAKLLLKENKLTISQISSSLGFNDYSVFYRWFSKETGKTPRKYRTEQQQKKRKIKE